MNRLTPHRLIVPSPRRCPAGLESGAYRRNAVKNENRVHPARQPSNFFFQLFSLFRFCPSLRSKRPAFAFCPSLAILTLPGKQNVLAGQFRPGKGHPPIQHPSSILLSSILLSSILPRSHGTLARLPASLFRLLPLTFLIASRPFSTVT